MFVCDTISSVSSEISSELTLAPSSCELLRLQLESSDSGIWNGRVGTEVNEEIITWRRDNECARLSVELKLFLLSAWTQPNGVRSPIGNSCFFHLINFNPDDLITSCLFEMHCPRPKVWFSIGGVWGAAFFPYFSWVHPSFFQSSQSYSTKKPISIMTSKY